MDLQEARRLVHNFAAQHQAVVDLKGAADVILDAQKDVPALLAKKELATREAEAARQAADDAKQDHERRLASYEEDALRARQQADRDVVSARRSAQQEIDTVLKHRDEVKAAYEYEATAMAEEKAALTAERDAVAKEVSDLKIELDALKRRFGG